MVVRVIE